MRLRPVLAAAVVAAAVLPAAPAIAGPGSCVAVATAAAGCSYYSAGGPVTLRCAATTCDVRVGVYGDNTCGLGCTRTFWADYNEKVTLTVKGAGAGTIGDS